ncbi:MAG: cytochrome c1, partial [Sinobacteraceae bacterium]|nr:cytochrome c1 [Nevskiaceae bacterium]
ISYRASPGNIGSVQRGARDFMNYCAGCHTLKYLRYERLASDLNIPKNLLKKNLMFVAGQKTSSHVLNGMSAAEGKSFFAKAPPDLTLEAGHRGAKWIYSYLHGFYLDPSRPTGVNNTLIPNVAMPDVMWSLQGWQKRVEDEDGGYTLKSVTQGSMTPDQFDGFVRDISNFLAYAATPEHHTRMIVGPFVLLYLLILGVLCYLVKRAFWKDVHE